MVTPEGTLTMTSREIAELTGKQHQHVMADIRHMLGELGLMYVEFSTYIQVPGPNGGVRQSPIYSLPKDLTITLVSGYSVPMRHKIVMADIRHMLGELGLTWADFSAYVPGLNLRTVMREGAPWFVAKDVCDALGMTNPTNATADIDADERAKFNLGQRGLDPEEFTPCFKAGVSTPGLPPASLLVSESGLYSLILKSRKPEARPCGASVRK